MTDPQQQRPWFRRVPWILVIAAAIIILISIVIAVVARGSAVDEVSLGALSAFAPLHA